MVYKVILDCLQMTLHITVDNPETAAAQLNDDLNSIKAWADQWLVNFNPTKTKKYDCL
jgi:hypothetical protein